MYKVARKILVLLLLVPAGCSEPPVIKGVAAAKTTVESTVPGVTSGTVKAEKVAELAFGSVGRVYRLNVKLGDRAGKDQILAELENDDLKVALDTAVAEAKRQEDLARAKSASQQDLDRARAALAQARIAYEKSLIRAPYDGIIVELNLELGQLSQITAVIPAAPVRIMDIEPRYIKAEIDEVDRPRVREGMPARVRILALRREPFHATVRKIVPWVSSAREQERTSEIELAIDSENLLLPAGASADVEVIVEQLPDVLSVPTRTLLGRGESRYVYRFADGRVARTAVKAGIFNYDRAQILQGLSAGDIVLFPAESVELKDQLKVKVDLQTWP